MWINLRKNKIGTLTFHRAQNYGAILQCYSLQRALINIGYETEVLDYDCKKISNDYSLIKTNSLIDFLKTIFFLPAYRRKRDRFGSFISKHIIVSSKCLCSEMYKVEDEYDAIIVGSDQVWNYKLTGCDRAYFLDFLSERKKRLSYAASLGIKEIPEKYRSFYQNNIEGMGFISVREKTASRMIEKLCGRKSDVVLDPVFLQTAEQWRSIMPKIKETEYIFVYMPGEDTPNKVKELAKRKKLKVINCAYDVSFRKFKRNIGDVRLSMGPDEFIALLDGADYVVTGSFHATAFSLIFQKNFFVEVPPHVGSRITDLLDTFGLQNRTFNANSSIDENTEIDWQRVSNKLNELREMSLISLKKSIEGAVDG